MFNIPLPQPIPIAAITYHSMLYKFKIPVLFDFPISHRVLGICV